MRNANKKARDEYQNTLKELMHRRPEAKATITLKTDIDGSDRKFLSVRWENVGKDEEMWENLRMFNSLLEFWGKD